MGRSALREDKLPPRAKGKPCEEMENRQTEREEEDCKGRCYQSGGKGAEKEKPCPVARLSQPQQPTPSCFDYILLLPFTDQMFAVQPGVAEGAQFLGGPPPAVRPPELQADSNSNFMASAKDANENWPEMPGQVEPKVMRSSSRLPSDNQGFQVPGLPEGEVRCPPEGAEIPRAGPEKMGGASTVCSPLEDNGYASSSLSIDSSSCSPEPACGTPLGPGPSDPLLPSVAQAVQQLQAQERYKEQEKEKHHVHLVMYRRLALLQWIRGLQHQLVDQQARLQESFDTILDNRKELIRCLHQRAAPSRPQDQG